MPNLDGGHYFLTVLAPVDNTGIVEYDGVKSSPIHMVRDALEALPTALQSPAAEEVGIQSPFARNARTHLARIVVIDAPYYNGRNPANSIVSAVKGTDLLSPQPVDELACPYLLFAADFDPVPGDGSEEPRSYLEALWTVASTELRSVFQYCYGFEAVTDPASFATYMIACQIETTMPFNDYWITPPPIPTLPIWTLLIAPVVAVALGVGVWMATQAWWLGAVSLPVLLAAALAIDYAVIMSKGAKPFPTAPNSTLPHVLKALYLQQAFTRFVIDQQGATPAAIQAAFAQFIATHRPTDLVSPTQPPGVVRTLFAKAS